MNKIVIAIDGYSSCGKSTTAKALAAQLGYSYIDSGAMYRAVTLYFLQNYIELTNPKAIEKALEAIDIKFVFNQELNKSETFLNGLNIENEIRQMYVSDNVSEVSAIPVVRHAMVLQQQRLGRKKGVVMDGRDIGTTVFPDAELKIFMTSDMFIRAKRRQDEYLANEILVEFEEVIKNLEKRDLIDTTRDESPLRKADDAFLLDNTYMTIEEQVEYVFELAMLRIVQNDRKIVLSKV
jgi:CMP/dCMP kinase